MDKIAYQFENELKDKMFRAKRNADIIQPVLTR